MTVQLELTTAWTNKNIFTLFDDFYQDHSNIEISEEIPNLKQVVFGDRCRVGGFKLSENGKRLSYVSCLDNLLKGAASQALQNIELVMNKTM